MHQWSSNNIDAYDSIIDYYYKSKASKTKDKNNEINMKDNTLIFTDFIKDIPISEYYYSKWYEPY